MESSTLAAPETPQEEVVFQSEASNYRIVMEPMRRKQIGEGSEVEVVGGRAIQFYDGVHKTTDPEEIAFLRESDSNGQYFWEIGTDADRPTDASGLIKEIIHKGREGDYDRIAEILVAERSGTSRPDVLAACAAVLEDAKQELPPKPEVPLHELQRVRMGPTAGVTPGVSPDPVPGTPEVDPSTLQPPVGAAPAVPEEAPAVPPAQVPAIEPSATATPEPETPSATMPSAQGPLAGGEPPLVGDVTEAPEVPASEPETAPAATPEQEGEPTPASGEGADTSPATDTSPTSPSPTGEAGGAPGAPAAPEGGQQG
jgi:hypothetical protein